MFHWIHNRESGWQAAKIGRGPSVCCRCVWNSNSRMQRCHDNGKQALPGENDADMAAATRTHTRGPSQPLSSGPHHA
ncbi:RIKEN cDNA 4931422A03 [Mus musculus]|nr:RIKEN cDNA 4931422A03 [Mus musculus]